MVINLLTFLTIWETISDYVDPTTGNGFDISLPVSMDEWYAMTQAFSRAEMMQKEQEQG